ncbi:MAG: hypothetical protein AUG75_05990 [Cyanobacteria bacterium 13_1_20CM_4_61_6]|nr:MAG: hypothetical protein AUG75_05990 [Cyanobacteria bacterium 13_1_20CM_4_61_6]
MQGGDDPGMHRDNRAIENGAIENVAIEKIQLRRGKPRGAATNPVWENYPLDVSFVIDSLAELQNDLPQLRRKPDAEHIGVAGQGTGAFAAEVIAGALIDLPGHPRSNLADPRVRAILCVPPQGPGRFGLTERSFEQLVLPFLGMAAPRAGNPAVNSVASHRAPFERSQTGDKYELSVQEIDPGVIRKNVASGTGSEPVSGEFDSLDNHTGSAALAFWDAYLKHDLVARRYLQSDTLERSSHGAVKLERR